MHCRHRLGKQHPPPKSALTFLVFMALSEKHAAEA